MGKKYVKFNNKKYNGYAKTIYAGIEKHLIQFSE
jgi:hypothetical protein